MVKIHEIRIVGGSNPIVDASNPWNPYCWWLKSMKSLPLMVKIYEIPIVDG